MAVVATSTPKRHGFSIESLIGPRADSPRRQGHGGLLPRAEDFSITRDFVCGSAGRDSSISSSSSSSSSAAVVRPDGAGSSRDRLRDLIRDTTNTRESSSPRDSVKDSGAHCRDSYRDRSSSGSPRDAVREGFRDREVVPHTRDSAGRERERGRPRSRQGTVSPSSSAADEDKAGGGRGSSPASSSPAADVGPLSPRLEKTLPSSSPETENRLTGGWSSDDLKHLLGTAGAFQHQAHHQQHHPHHHGVGVDGSSLYQPLRVCNRSLSAAMSSAAAALMPHQFAGLPVNPLLYNLHRELASAPHPSVHPLLAARYPGFVHPRYPMGPPPGLLFHPYRKPKRNRTAFSPSQLLQLEQAFEKNHYVVGQERKTLASKLQLTETQVKVWFQNRRTKHKRMKAEEEATGCGVTSADDAGKTGDNSEGHMDMKSDASDHELMEDDICTSDEELSVTEDS